MKRNAAGSEPDPNLRATLCEASLALGRLDADRLDAMARYCEVLIRGTEVVPFSSNGSEPEAREANLNPMRTLERVLEATRANLEVLRRLHDRSPEQLEYGPASLGGSWRAGGERGID
jgi:hypothetical protein